MKDLVHYLSCISGDHYETACGRHLTAASLTAVLVTHSDDHVTCPGCRKARAHPGDPLLPTERALQAEALAQEYLRRLARARVRLDHGDAEGAREECEQAWMEQPWEVWSDFQTLRAEAAAEFYPEVNHEE